MFLVKIIGHSNGWFVVDNNELDDLRDQFQFSEFKLEIVEV